MKQSINENFLWCAFQNGKQTRKKTGNPPFIWRNLFKFKSSKALWEGEQTGLVSKLENADVQKWLGFYLCFCFRTEPAATSILLNTQSCQRPAPLTAGHSLSRFCERRSLLFQGMCVKRTLSAPTAMHGEGCRGTGWHRTTGATSCPANGTLLLETLAICHLSPD